MTEKDKLRMQAEASLAQSVRLPAAKNLAAPSPEETRQTLHELRVHQIELEIQNEELRRAQAELEITQARYFDLYDLAPVGYVTISEKGLILEANLTATGLLGVARGALVKRLLTQFILKEDQDIYYLHRKQLFETGKPQACELRMVKKDSTAFWARMDATITQNTDGAPVYRVVLSDITERKQAEETLQTSEERFRKLFERHSAVKLVLDPETGTIIDANEAAAQFYGWPIEELKQMRIQQINSLPPEAVKAEMEKARSSERTRFEFRHRKADGSIRDVEVFSNKIEIKGKELLYSIIHDITERKLAEENIQLLNTRLEQLALTDYLTNLYNRRYFMRRGSEEFKRANRNSQPLALLMLDIDELKKINDTNGHEAGDLALQQIAEALKSSLREIDIIGRLGGDEFAVLLPNTLLDDAVLLAERIRLFIANISFQTPGDVLISTITISVGAATFTNDMSGIDDLLRNADVALYRAKNSGRNCVRVY